MKIADIKNYFDSIYPRSLSENWDNDGDMIVTDGACDVKGILVTLDVTDDAVDTAVENGANLIISHHPLIFDAIKHIDSSPKMKMIARLIRSGISVLSYHTRFDSAENGMNACLAKRLALSTPTPFGFDGETPMGRIGEVEECTPAEFASVVAERLNTEVLFYEGKRSIKRVAVVGGGGKGFIHLAHTLGADAIVTGDISYSVVREEMPYGITMIDAGHFGTEKICVDAFADAIKAEFGIDAVRFYDVDPCKIVTPLNI